MNIKSLLLGSAAALVAVTSSQAADVVVAEPVEYVRVCDVYGTGFFYIPGTETCLRVSGYARLQFNVAGDPAFNTEGDDYQVNTRVRARLNFDAREETELGQLRAFVRLQATNTSGAGNGISMEHAYLQLGGLLMGYRDSLWSSGIGGLEDGLLTDSDLVVGDFNTNQVNYTFAVGGFSATVGIEDDGTGDVVPDVHGKLVYSGAWGGAFLSAVYDETFNREDIPSALGTNVAFGNFFFRPDQTLFPTRLQDGSNDAFALKGGVQLRDLLVADSRLKIEGHWASDPTVYAVIPGLTTTGSFAANNPNINNPTPGSLPITLEWAAGAGYAQGFGRFGAAIAGQYGETFNQTFLVRNVVTGQAFNLASTGDYFAVVGNLGYEITNNFNALAEVSYRNVDFNGIGDQDQTSGFLRFQREF